MRKQGAFYLMVGSVLVLALLITLRPDLNLTRWIPSAFASRGRTVLEGGIWMTYANGDAVQALAVQDDTLWVGTHLGGLVRWDISTKTYTQYLYPQTDLPSNDVRAVGIDRLGRIWVGTDRGLAVLSSDGSTIVAHHTGNSGLPADEVMDVRVGPDGRVWVATYGGGVGVLDDKGTTEDLSDDRWTIYDLDDGLPSSLITALEFDEAGNVWIGFWITRLDFDEAGDWTGTGPHSNADPETQAPLGGVCVLAGRSFFCYSADNSALSYHPVVALGSGGGEEMWVGILGGGVTLFQGREGSQTFNTMNSGLAGNWVSAIARDSLDRMWFAVAWSWKGQGISILQDGFWRTPTTANSGLISDDVSAIVAEDSHMWLGHRDDHGGGGVQAVRVLRAAGEKWTTYDFTTSFIPSEQITSIAQETLKRLWFGTMDRGVLLYERDDDRWHSYDQNTTGGGLPSEVVRDIAVDQSGRVWLATNKGGSVFSESWTAYTRDTTRNKLRSDNLRAVAVGAEGKIWFGHDRGVDILDHHGTPHDPSDDTWLGFGSVLPGRDVRDIVHDASNQIWVATDGGLSVYDGRQWRVHQEPDLISNDVQALFYDSHTSQLWAGTAGGVSVFDEDTRTWTSYTTADGLVDDDVQAIGADSWRRVWFATPRGVSVKDGEVWITYTSADFGLAADDVTSILVDGSGLVWLGTRSHGVSTFDSSVWDDSAIWEDFVFADQGLPSNHITDIAIGADGGVWAATADRGLSILRGTTWTTYSRASTGGGLASDRVLSIAIAEDGRMWAGTVPFRSGGQWVGGGITVLDPTSGSWTTYNKDNTGPTGLQGDWIQKIAIDAADRLWIGTGVPSNEPSNLWGYGLTIYDHGYWTTYTRDNTDLGLSSDRVSDIAFDSHGGVWLATEPALNPADFSFGEGSVSRLDLGENGVPDPPGEGDDSWASWRTNDESSGLVAWPEGEGRGDLSSIHIDQADVAWAGGWTKTEEWSGWAEGTLNQFIDPLWTAHIEPFTNAGPILSITSDAGDNLWVGTGSYYIFAQIPQGVRLARAENWLESGSRGPLQAWHSGGDGQNEASTISTSRAGVYFFDGESWQRFATPEYPLVSNDITVIRVDPQGEVWFGTEGGGISRYTPPTPTPTPSSTPTQTATDTPSPTPTATATGTPTAAATETAIPTATSSPSATPTAHPVWLPSLLKSYPATPTPPTLR